MALTKVERGLGMRYPRSPDEVVTFIQRVAGPLMAEMKDRINKLENELGVHIEADEATLAAVDTEDFVDGSLGIATSERNLFSLEKGGTAGGSDLSANPTGRWKFIQAL